MLLHLAYLGITNAFALLRLLPGDGRDKDIEILSLRHQLALLHPLPRPTLRRLRLLVQPDTILKWHRDLLARRNAAVLPPRHRGRPRTLRPIRALVLRLARENGTWGHRRMHGELLTLGIRVAPSTVWEIPRQAGIDPAPDRAATTWTDFLRSQADALLPADFIETVTLTGARLYILTVIEHASRRPVVGLLHLAGRGPPSRPCRAAGAGRPTRSAGTGPARLCATAAGRVGWKR